MRHALSILVALALALLGGGVVFWSRANLTPTVVIAGFGTIYFALFLALRTDSTAAASALASSAKSVVEACKSVIGSGGAS